MTRDNTVKFEQMPHGFIAVRKRDGKTILEVRAAYSSRKRDSSTYACIDIIGPGKSRVAVIGSSRRIDVCVRGDAQVLRVQKGKAK